MDWTRVNQTVKWAAGTCLLGLATIAAISAYQWWNKPPVDTTVAVIAKPAPVIAKAKKKVVKPKQVIVYADEAKAKLKLPPSVLANAEQQVTGATVVSPSERRVTVTSVLDTRTGETTTYTKPEPYPWLAVESRGEARFDVGYKITREALVPMPVGRLTVTHNFLQVKALHLGVNAAVDSDGTAFVGVGLAFRW